MSNTKKGKPSQDKRKNNRPDIITTEIPFKAGQLPSAFRDDGTSPATASPVLLKPREELSYKEFYPHLDIKAPLEVVWSPQSSKGKSVKAAPLGNVLVPKCDASELPQVEYSQLSQPKKPSKKSPLKQNKSYYRYVQPSEQDLENRVEYDMDEQDRVWLERINKQRKFDYLDEITFELFELVVDQLEKQWFLLTKDMTRLHSAEPFMSHEDTLCSICLDGEADNSNAIIFCDGCNVAVHQECYGVPFIPEGQWLCRKCMLAPEGGVSCVLCPNTDGAFKQTTGNQWAHLLCALWIPEVSIVNHVYAEPIDGIEKIPKSRWRLTCYLCKKDSGACIQCYKSNCYQAFHVTCARKARFYMKMKHYTHNGTDYSINKAFCHKHTPADHEFDLSPFNQVDDSAEDYSFQKDPQAIQSVVAKRKGFPTLSPVAPEYILQQLSDRLDRDGVKILQRQKFVVALCKYWALKRASRRGAPLIKRLHLEPWTSFPSANQETETIRIERFRLLTRLRADLEQVRLIADLTRKREREKLKSVKVMQEILQKQLSPISSLLQQFLTELIAVDKFEYFRIPVEKKYVPDYYDIVKQPMDFKKIQERVEHYYYSTLNPFAADVQLIVSNCMLYNKPDTPFVKSAIKLQQFLDAQLPVYKTRLQEAIQEAAGLPSFSINHEVFMYPSLPNLATDVVKASNKNSY